VQSNYQQAQQQQLVGSLSNADGESKVIGGKESAAAAAITKTADASKTEQDVSDEKVFDSNSDSQNQKQQPSSDAETRVSTISSIGSGGPATTHRRTSENPVLAAGGQNNSRFIKRRYKSGLPLTADRGDDDPIEEAYLKQYNPHLGSSKHSKDDMGKIH
jgi:hypothetical protein